MCEGNMSHKFLTFTILVTICTAYAVPRHESEKRVIDKPLSEHDHYVEGDHNVQYDHEAFLGDEAQQFDEFSPDESKRRLGLIFDKIDKNQDGLITAEELRKWIQYTQRRYLLTDSEQQWRIHNPNNKPFITWAEYSKGNYGFLDSEPTDTEEFKTYNRMKERDRRRWKVADVDGDDSLTKEEFQNFMHPEDVVHMKDIVVIETIEDIDKDGDGKISLDEYISDLYRGEPGEEEPSWVEAERDSFRNFRDKNKDGYMDHDEVKDWIMPDEFDHAEAETNHLIHAADQNGDKQLSKEEVLEKYDIFVGSQATDFGEALTKHDEF